MQNPNPPAFPRPASKTCATGRPERVEPHEGMSLLDWFAGQALAGLILRGDAAHPEVLAQAAYQVAVAMLAERSKS